LIDDTPCRQKELPGKLPILTEPTPVLSAFAADIKGPDTAPEKFLLDGTYDRKVSACTATGQQDRVLSGSALRIYRFLTSHFPLLSI